MRYLILADLHSNIEALDALLEVVKGETFDRYLILGDLVGYNASPKEVLERVRALQPQTILRGNHDKVCASLEAGENFNLVAKEAAYWTRKVLNQDEVDYLQGLPKGPLEIEPGVWIAHGAPHDEDFYITSRKDAYHAFQSSEFDICFYGHSHINGAYMLDRRSLDFLSSTANLWGYYLEPGVRYLVNPGSVGQPRDRNPHTCCALYDSEQRHVKMIRATYDIKATQQKIYGATLNHSLATRLEVGA